MNQIFKNFFDDNEIVIKGKINIFSTPNRLIVHINKIPKDAIKKAEEIRGPNINAPEKALEGFLKSNKISKEKVFKKSTEKGIFYFYKKPSQKIKSYDLDYIWHPFTQMKEYLKEDPLVIEDSDGVYLIDSDGNRYIDGVSSLWVNIHGHKVSKINKAIKILEPAKKLIICWAMGLTQHKNGVDNIKECVNLLLLKGSIGKKGAGTCPVRGHSNVQGDRSVGIIHKTSPELSNALKETFEFDSPKNEGYDTVHSIKAMYNRKAKIFISLGGNFLSAASDTLYTAKALQNCDLTVSIST